MICQQLNTTQKVIEENIYFLYNFFEIYIFYIIDLTSFTFITCQFVNFLVVK